MVAVIARTRRVVVLDGEDVVADWKSNCHSQRAADVGRKEHADPRAAACGAEMAGEAVCVVDLKRGEESMWGGRWARWERPVWHLRWTQCWCAPRRGAGPWQWEERKSGKNNGFRD